MSKKQTRKASKPAPRHVEKELPLVTRQDLKGFDRESTDLILGAQGKGARVRISNRGHAILYGPNGTSTSVPPNLKSGNRSAQNTRAGVARLFKGKEG
jgi:hypothetical protein